MYLNFKKRWENKIIDSEYSEKKSLISESH